MLQKKKHKFKSAKKFLFIHKIINIWRAWKTNSLFNLINHQPDSDKNYLYAKDLNKAAKQFKAF